MNFSIVIGALLQGFLLLIQKFKLELESRIRPLRDFFFNNILCSSGMQLVFVGVANRLLLFGFLMVGA